MNRKEFNDWYKDYCAAYPGTDDQVQRGGDAKSTLDHWFAVLEAYELEDAKRVTRSMLAGRDEEPRFFAQTPRHVAGLCAKIVGERRRSRAPQQRLDQRSDNPANWNTPEICKQLVDCANAGGDVNALAGRLMPVDPANEPRYRCRFCQDNGVVLVWHPYSMKLAARKELTTFKGCYSTALRCSCDAGNRYDGMSRFDRRTWKNDRTEPVVFDDERWRICMGFKQEHVDDLTDFMAHWRPANYEHGFDEYNRAESY